ncbi:MAG: 3-hydroxyacyl-CoA dehydrogenase NAD-binding domain-containing protein [Ilumatobacteraceae bacterium]
MGRVQVTDHLGQLADCDLVIESIVEDLETKKTLFAELEQIVKPSGILATDASTLPVVELAMATQRPTGLWHPLLQPGTGHVTRRDHPAGHRQRRDDRHGDGVRGLRQGSVQVQDQAGFIVNALLFPYLNSTIRMMEFGTTTARRHRRSP